MLPIYQQGNALARLWQRRDHGDAAVSDTIIREYCGCFANGLANAFSPNDAKKLVGMERAEAIRLMEPTANEVAKRCRDDARAATEAN